MADSHCTECGLPSDEGLRCCACGGPAASEAQVRLWNNPALGALLDERLSQESVELSGHPGVRFAVGAASDLLLMEALGRPA